MRHLLKVGAACTTMVLVMAGCTDRIDPLGPMEADVEWLAQTSSSGEICWGLDSTKPDFKRHVVFRSQSDLATGYRPDGTVRINSFTASDLVAALPDADFFPQEVPLVVGVVRLYNEHDSKDRVGGGYMVSAVEHVGKNTYNTYHQVVFLPWLDGEVRIFDEDGNWTGQIGWRTWDYNDVGLCTNPIPVRVCAVYDNPDSPEDGVGDCVLWLTRNACVGTFRATFSQGCNSLPCTTRGRLSIVADSWGGFVNGVSGPMNYFNGVLDSWQGEPVVYGWPHGLPCVTFSGSPPPVGPIGPTASFDVSCDGLTCTFTDQSTVGDSGIATWAWDFGDGDSSAAPSPTHTYQADGTYTVHLTVTDDNGLSDTAAEAVTVGTGGPGPDPVDLLIDRFDVTNTSNPQFARVMVKWEVSGVDLQTVEVKVVGQVNSDARTWTVSGASAAGEHEFSFRRGHGSYEVTLTVTAADAGPLAETKPIDLTQ